MYIMHRKLNCLIACQLIFIFVFVIHVGIMEDLIRRNSLLNKDCYRTILLILKYCLRNHRSLEDHIA